MVRDGVSYRRMLICTHLLPGYSPPPCSPSNSPVRVFDGSIASTTTASAALEPPTSLSVTTYAYAQYTLDRWVCLHMAML